MTNQEKILEAYNRFKSYFDKYDSIHIYPEYTKDLTIILQQRPRYSYWEKSGRVYACNCCGQVSEYKNNYCSNCGSYMNKD